MKYMKNESYADYWNKRGDYGKQRVLRMVARKKQRHNMAIVKRQRKAQTRMGGHWKDSDGTLWQYCEWPEGSICRYPCNGDC